MVPGMARVGADIRETDMQPLMTPPEVARLLGVSASWVYANKQRIGYVKVGAAVRFERSAVEGYALTCKRGPHDEEPDKWGSQSDTGKNVASGLSRKRTTVSDINARLQAQLKANGRRTSTPLPAKPH